MALDYRLIGTRIKTARESKNITQEKLAEMLGVSVPYISRIETGNTHINLDRLHEICCLLEISEAYILEGASHDSESYMTPELNSILKDCTPSDKEDIYKVAKIIKNRNKNK